MKPSELVSQTGLKVLFLHLGNSGISWYRMIQPANLMCDIDGIVPIYPNFDEELHDKYARDYEVNPDKNIEYLNQLFNMADVVVISKIHNLYFLATVQALADSHNCMIITEVDDTVFGVSGTHENQEFIGVGSELEQTSYQQIKASDHIIVSTEWLKSELSSIHDSVHVVPNAIDLNLWDIRRDRLPDGKVIVGWAGGGGHGKDLKLVKGAFEILFDKYPNLHFHCIHGADGLMKHKQFKNRLTWHHPSKWHKVMMKWKVDITIAPLWDNQFNRCKSNLKYLEYSALKLPTVCSKVEPYEKTVEDGVDGYFASTTQEWVDKISLLVDNIKLRTEIASNARKKVELHYDARKVVRSYADLLLDLNNKRGRKKIVQLSGNTK